MEVIMKKSIISLLICATLIVGSSFALKPNKQQEASESKQTEETLEKKKASFGDIPLEVLVYKILPFLHLNDCVQYIRTNQNLKKTVEDNKQFQTRMLEKISKNVWDEKVKEGKVTLQCTFKDLVQTISNYNEKQKPDRCLPAFLFYLACEATKNKADNLVNLILNHPKYPNPGYPVTKGFYPINENYFDNIEIEISDLLLHAEDSTARFIINHEKFPKNKKNAALIKLATQEENLELIEKLVELPEVSSVDLEDAFQEAVKKNNVEIAQFFLKSKKIDTKTRSFFFIKEHNKNSLTSFYGTIVRWAKIQAKEFGYNNILTMLNKYSK